MKLFNGLFDHLMTIYCGYFIDKVYWSYLKLEDFRNYKKGKEKFPFDNLQKDLHELFRTTKCKRITQGVYLRWNS